MKSYCAVRFPRAGLGNRLIPWARAEVFAEINQLDFVRPQWMQFKIGPFLRGEIDMRLYGGQFRQRAGYLPWWRGFYPFSRTINNPKLCDNANREDVAYVFDDHTILFSDLIGYRNIVSRRLCQVTRSNVKAKAEALGDSSLAVHIRLGDFKAIPGMASSIDWYARTIQELLKAFPKLSPALVFSDASDSEIAPVLSIPSVRRVTTGSALGDIWALSRSKVLVASGNSSFSAWASYLSQSPTLYEPGHDLRGFFNFDPAVNWIWEASLGKDATYLADLACIINR